MVVWMVYSVVVDKRGGWYQCGGIAVGPSLDGVVVFLWSGWMMLDNGLDEDLVVVVLLCGELWWLLVEHSGWRIIVFRKRMGIRHVFDLYCILCDILLFE